MCEHDTPREETPRRKRRRNRRHSSRIPSIHFTMIVVAAAMGFGAFIGHLIRPEDKLAEYVVTACLGALFGKFSNGFGHSPREMMGQPIDEDSRVYAGEEEEGDAV